MGTAQTRDERPEGAAVLIRAHGVPRAVYQRLEQKGCTVFDATCPFVQKIHRIVDRESRDGRLIVILGSAGHPEVVGIQGWCGESVVLDGEAQARAFTECQNVVDRPPSVVAQPSAHRSIWDISRGWITKRCPNPQLFTSNS